MAKETKTRRELEDMIAARTKHMFIQHLEVRREKAYGERGWEAYVQAVPQRAAEYQTAVESITRELRAIYDLED